MQPAPGPIGLGAGALLFLILSFKRRSTGVGPKNIWLTDINQITS